MSSHQRDSLKQKVSGLPDSPGVYFMKDGSGRIIYVGKAKTLSHRVKSYVQKYQNLDPKTKALVKATRDIDYIATRNEVEALVLECNLIKEYRPRYNIRLKDDKRYPFIKLTRNERFPRLLITRKVENDGAEYFGPYTDARAVRRTLRLIGSVFPLRSCSKRISASPKDRECLNFHIGRCLGPCAGKVNELGYGEIVDQVRLFLRGKNNELVETLRRKMKELSDRMLYEDAAVVRNQIDAVETISQRQLASVPGLNDADVVALAREGNRSCGVVMKIRDGKILGSEAFMVPASARVPDGSVFEAFFELYYHAATDIPGEIYTQYGMGDAELHERWLLDMTGKRVSIVNPRRGDKRKLIEIAGKNAWFRLVAETGRKGKERIILGEVKKTLGLPATPFRIEAYDISHIQGRDAVGAMVTFENGVPYKAGYRYFRIGSVEVINDYAMLEEVLTRRLRHLVEGREKRPDLVLVDGGAGQVATAMRAMEGAGVIGVPIIGLAKKNEELYRTESNEVLRLPQRSEVLRFLQRIRNEVHRFAVSYHRKLRSRRLSHSTLEEIPGIGEKRKMLLLSAFGSVEAIAGASVEEIASIPGIGGKLAEEIHRFVNR